MALDPTTSPAAPDHVPNNGEPAVPASARRTSRLRRRVAGPQLLLLEQSLTFVVFVAILASYAVWLGERFVNADQRLLDVHQNVPFLLIGLAVAIALIAGEFDLSVGGTATLACYLTIGLVAKQDWSMPVVLGTVLVVGIVAGAINAALVIGLELNGFIATLGTGGVLAGISAVYSGGTLLAPVMGGPSMPLWFREFGSFQEKVPQPITWVMVIGFLAILILGVADRSSEARRKRDVATACVGAVALLVLFATILRVFIVAMPWTIVILLMVTTGVWLTMRYTPFGRHMYATGGNAQAAQLAGVRTTRVTSWAFVLSGVLAAAAGIVLASIQGSASPNIGQNFVLPAFAAAFLSTVLLSLGRIHLWGTVTGGIVLIWVGQGLVIGGVHFTWLGVINGVVLIGAVALSSLLRRSRRR